jgi:hypothetical protein
MSFWPPACCARGERPGDRRTTDKRDELASLHSITLSAMARVLFADNEGRQPFLAG